MLKQETQIHIQDKILSYIYKNNCFGLAVTLILLNILLHFYLFSWHVHMSV